jgi:hypothetical protein
MRANGGPALIGPKDAPINIVGGYRFSGAPKVDIGRWS